MQLETDKIMLVLLSAVIIASGCMDNGEADAVKTAPMQVNSFSASPNPAQADTNVMFDIELENTGDADAENTAIRLFGPTFATDTGQDKTWRPANPDDGAIDEAADRTRYIGTVRAPTDNSPSVPETEMITLTAPAYEEGREATDLFQMDIFYQYETTATTQLDIMTAEHFQDNNIQRTEPTLETTAGPVQLDIRGSTPKVQYEGDEDDELCVIVRNDGEGEVFHPDDGFIGTEGTRAYDVNSDVRDRVKLSVEDVGNIDFEPNEATVRLVRGEQVQCFDWSADGLIQQREQTVNIELDAEYGYTKTDQTSVTVEGRYVP